MEKIKLTKKFIDENLFTKNKKNLNSRRLHMYTQDGIHPISSEEIYLAYHIVNLDFKNCETPGCNNTTSFINFFRGYAKCCSNKCATINPKRQIKSKNSCLERFGVKNRLILVKNSQNTKQTTENYILDCNKTHLCRFLYHNTKYVDASTKISVTCRVHGDWQVIPDAHKSGNICPKCAKIRKVRKSRKGKKTIHPQRILYYIYCKLVDIETKKNQKYVKNIESRSYNWHLDHKYSKIQGFKNNILPYIIGSVVNLEIIHKSINCSKRGDCSITKDELFSTIKLET